MKKKITVLPGDGIGPEIVNQAMKVMSAVNRVFKHEFKYTQELIGAASMDMHDIPITDEVIEKCKASDAVFLGAIGHPKYDNSPSHKIRPEQGLLTIRKELSLFSNIRPIATYDISKYSSPLKEDIIKDIDFVIYRELTGGLYFGDKYLSEDGGYASDNCAYSRLEIERISRLAFESAMERRKKLTLVDKANVLETSRLWRTVVQELSKEYPDVNVEYLYVDNAAMQLMLNPKQFDVLLTENLFGDILSDLASVITGSIGLLPSASIGTDSAMFEPVHGSYPEAAGKDIANPFATILSLAMMYDHFGLFGEAKVIRKSVDWAMSENFVTKDLSENYLTCSKIGDLIAYYIEENGEVILNRENMEHHAMYI